MRDNISLALIFATALLGDSEPYILIPFVVVIGLLQIDKIDNLFKR